MSSSSNGSNSSSDIVIDVRGLSKMYRIAHERTQRTTFGDAVMQRVRNPLKRAKFEDFWALKDVSFDVGHGEVVGIIGRNGAGKSTLLKILSRVTEPTAGVIDLYGRVGSLLEVGTGFHPELTGRENIFLNGSMLGMRRAEIRRQFDAIVDFAEVEKFLDTPVKRYSSGMYVRLAFAVAAHLEPEILIVDEVLAVGDAQFQKKCLGKMRDVAGGGRTVLFVSHNLQAIRELCTRAIVMRHGSIARMGGIEECLSYYLGEDGGGADNTWRRDGEETRRAPAGPLVFESAAVEHAPAVEPGGNGRLTVELLLRTLRPHKPAFLAVDILDPSGAAIMQALPTCTPFISDSRAEHELSVGIDLPPLVPGRYSLTLWTGPHNTETYDLVRACVSFEVNNSPTPGRTFPHTADHGYIVPGSSVQYPAAAATAAAATTVSADVSYRDEELGVAK